MKPRFFKRMTIATRLLWAFLVMALVPLSVVTSRTSTISEPSLRVVVANNLRAIANSKANQIETYARASATSPPCRVVLTTSSPRCQGCPL